LKINGETAGPLLDEALSTFRPGDTIRITVRTREGAERDLSLTLAAREDFEYDLKDLDTVTPQQRARRAAWLSADQGSEAARP
jgi:hypothetical protein